MAKIKSLKELSLEAHMAALKQSKQGKEIGEMTAIGLGHVGSIVTNILTQDRLSHKEAIVEVLNGTRATSYDEKNLSTDETVAYNQAIDQALAIVNLIYKDSE